MKNTVKCLWAVALAAAMVFSACDDGSSTVKSVPVSGISLDKGTLALVVGGTATLTPTIQPDNATNQNISWSSGDTNIATVTNGIVTALAVGRATITVTTADGNKKATCAVTVNPAVPVTGVTLNESSLSLTVEDTETLTATVQPADATNKTVTWSSSDENVATVSDGAVTAKAVGTATITVTTADGNKTATCAVTVNPAVPVTGVTLNESSLSLTVRGTETLTATIAPENATNKNVTWTSSNDSVATVTNGMVTAVAAGTATITVTTANGNKTATCAVTVHAHEYITSTTGIELALIPAGTFTMGQTVIATPEHSVTLTKSFYMGKYEVTQEQYQTVMGTNPSNFKSAVSGESGTPGKLPVEMVTWYDAVEFCNKLSVLEELEEVYTISGRTPVSGYPITSATVTADFTKNGYRLPTEAQWEYACRAGTTTQYNTGNTIIDDTDSTITDNTGWYYSNSGNKTHEVGLKPVNAWGLYDMHGNVYEWCWDWYEDYSSEAQTDPTGASSGTYRVARGGCYSSSRWAVDLRSAGRNSSFKPNYWGSIFGFRLVRP